jgi:hypothetical protein
LNSRTTFASAGSLARIASRADAELITRKGY